jgi:hypothetical protein
MADMPPRLGRARITADRLPAGADFSDLKSEFISDEQWQTGWSFLWSALERYLAGDSLAEIARFAFHIQGDIDNRRSDGKQPLPKTIGFIDRATYGLSMIAGGIAATLDVAREQAAGPEWALDATQRAALELLPLAVRNGCGDRSSLSWYRFGIRHRRAAHLLASTMPLPEQLGDDAAVEGWVRTERAAWVDSLLDEAADDPAAIPTAESAIAFLIADGPSGD